MHHSVMTTTAMSTTTTVPFLNEKWDTDTPITSICIDTNTCDETISHFLTKGGICLILPGKCNPTIVGIINLLFTKKCLGGLCKGCCDLIKGSGKTSGGILHTDKIDCPAEHTILRSFELFIHKQNAVEIFKIYADIWTQSRTPYMGLTCDKEKTQFYTDHAALLYEANRLREAEIEEVIRFGYLSLGVFLDTWRQVKEYKKNFILGGAKTIRIKGKSYKWVPKS